MEGESIVFLSLAIFQPFLFRLANVLNVYHVLGNFTLRNFNKSWLLVNGNCVERREVLFHFILITNASVKHRFVKLEVEDQDER